MKGIIIISLLFSLNYINTSILHDIMKNLSNKPVKEQFKIWHYMMNKPYSLNSELALKKYKVFKENLKLIKETNNKNLGYKLGFSPFTDITYQEFLDVYSSKSSTIIAYESINKNNVKPINTNLNIKDSIDWSYLWPEGAKNQENCGGCWAYSVIGTIEGHARIIKNQNLSLSVGQLIECNVNKTNRGCNGGKSLFGFKYLTSDNNYISLEQDYPHEPKHQDEVKECVKESKPYLKVKSYDYCFKYNNKNCNEEKIISYLQKGPYSSAIQIEPEFIHYNEGPYIFKECKIENHDIVVVSYEKEKNYVKIRNSWGSDWGDKGFALISTKDNIFSNGCGLLSTAFIPTELEFIS